MAIIFSADFHGNIETFEKELKIKYQNEYKDKDVKYHIILGDGDFPIQNDVFNKWYKLLTVLPIPILCVIGNHDPILGIKDLTKFEKDIGIGEKVYVLNEEKPFVAYLKRGKEYNIDGFKFLVLGGGLTVNKAERMEKGTFYKKEYWSIMEKWKLFKLLKTKNNFDYVLSHTGPHRINKIKFEKEINAIKEIDKVALMNDKIDKKIQCHGWLCGHWHKNEEHTDEKTGRKYHYIGKDTLKILIKENGEIKIY